MINENLVHAKFKFDELKSVYIGLHNPLSRWNGWANPFISEKSIKKLIRHLKVNDELIIKMQKDKSLYILDTQYPDYEADILEPIEIDGQIYYYFGYLGYCFNSIKIN
jgi:hypothetical protein